ncbi:MAG: ZIP family metal transporter [Bacilli bacterium]|nr:ZIP family metal transporter [Bacilli bacterium]
MINTFINLNPIIQAFIATIFTWLITLLGASLVFFFKNINKNIMDGMLGFAAGIMISASFFSLLSPAIEMAKNLKINIWLTTSIGFITGGLLLFIGDKIFEKKYENKKEKNSLKRIIMLILSITLHNIPEGLAVGVAFGSISYNLDGATIGSACILAFGIALQNFPEGTAVSVPLRREGLSRNKSFFWGQLSGIVEPIAGVLGALMVIKIRLILPFILSFAAGAMIYVVIQELIPASQSNERKDLMALFSLLGFVTMMILDIALT